MLLGKKKISTHDLGRSIYDGLIRKTFSDPQNDLSYRTIMLETLKISEPLPGSHFIEVIAGILFGAQLAISEKFHFDATMDKINNGILEEISLHLKQLRFKESEIDELVSKGFSRLDEYFQIFTKGKDSSTMFILGERFYWNILGREDKSAKLLEIAPLASSKMVFAQQCVRKFLDQYKVT
jgi:hypothetical protein